MLADAPAEDELAEAFDRIVSEGAQRLHRSWREVLTTGFAGGLEVATGVIAMLAVCAETGSHLLAGLMLFHSILDSLIVFGGIHAGAPYGYGDWLAWFWYTTLLNIVGGLGVVTLLRLVRSKELIEQERQKVSDGD